MHGEVEKTFYGGTGMTTGLFANFTQVRIINLVDRPDRRMEMTSQLARLGGLSENVGFFDAERPIECGEFPSLGARGCFESHLSVLRSARDDAISSLLILEDDFDFSKDGQRRVREVMEHLATKEWDFFYGAHVMPVGGRRGLQAVASDEPVLTASFIALSGRVIAPLVAFLDAMLLRPAGSAEFGPMHVDGAYTVFRMLHPQYRTFAAFPSLGHQRSSRSDITPSNMLLDRWALTRPVGSLLRGAYNWILRR